jgi:transposase
VVRQQEEAGKLVVEVVSTAVVAWCPGCGRVSGKVHDRRAQRKKDVPLGGRAVELVMWRRRFRCPGCRTEQGRPRTFSEPEVGCGHGPKGRVRRTTERLRRRVGEQARQRTVKEVAQAYHVGQRLVRECFAALARGLVTPPCTTPRVLALDDCSLRRGVRYNTIVCDWKQRRVLEMLNGRDEAAVRPYLEGLSDPDAVAAVVMDMSAAYRQVVEWCLPNAAIVVDRFHAIKRVGEALDGVRRRLQREHGGERSQQLSRRRCALLKAPSDLTDAENRDLAALFTASLELRRAWLRYQAFRSWFDLPDRPTAAERLALWEDHLRTDNSPEFLALFAQGSMLGSWREQLLNYFDYRVSNGYVEGKNNRTKQLQRQAYGYRNRENLRLRVLLPTA